MTSVVETVYYQSVSKKPRWTVNARDPLFFQKEIKKELSRESAGNTTEQAMVVNKLLIYCVVQRLLRILVLCLELRSGHCASPQVVAYRIDSEAPKGREVDIIKSRF